MGRVPRLGVFGGTFDPPHLGHVALAQWAVEALALDRMLFVPAGHPPHKLRRTITPAKHRLAMARLAARDNPAFAVSTIELENDEPSFTLTTLERLAARHAGDLYLVIGADSLDDFRGWHEPDSILSLARLAVAGRPGSGHPATLAWARRTKRVVWIGNPPIDVSSSLVRERVRGGHSCRYLVPDPVWRYVEKHRLYRR